MTYKHLFQDTLGFLQECTEYMEDGNLSHEESRARDQLINLCTEISGDYGGNEEVE